MQRTSLIDLQEDELQEFLTSPVNPVSNLLCLADAALMNDRQGVVENMATGSDGVIASCPDSRQPWSGEQHAQRQQTTEHSGETEEPSAGTNRFGALSQRAAEYSGRREELSGSARRRGDTQWRGKERKSDSAWRPLKSKSSSVGADRDEEFRRRRSPEYVCESRRNRQSRRIQTDSSSDEDVVSAWGREKPEYRRGEQRTVHGQERTKVKFQPVEREMKDVYGKEASRSRRRSPVWSDSEDVQSSSSDASGNNSLVKAGRSSTPRSYSRGRSGRAGMNYHPSGYNVGTKLGTYNGSTCLETFLAKFENCAQYFRWNSEDRLFHLRGSLEGPAGEVLWAAGKHTSVKELVKLLRNRFGNESQAERFRAELRARLRRPGESLQSLYIDICRLMALAYPGPPSDLSQIVARDAFLEALNEKSLRVRILEREPTTLDAALNIACRLEAFDKGNAEHTERLDAGNKHRDRYIKTATCADGKTNSSSEVNGRISAQLTELLSGVEFCKSELLQQRKELDNVHLQQQQARNVDRNVTWFNGREDACFSDPSGYGVGWYSGQSRPNVPYAEAENSTGTSRPPQEGSSAYRPRSRQRIGKDTCRKCGQKGHWARECLGKRTAKAQSDMKLMATSNGRSVQSADVYLPVSIRGKRTLALLDTGCETSVIGRRLVSDADLEPTSNRLFAANGTVIPLLGQLDVNLTVNGHPISAKVVVLDAVHELILGIDFLSSHKCRWEFGRGMIEIDGRKIQLQSRPTSQRVFRLYSEVETVITAGQQSHVPVQVSLSDLRERRANWVVEPRTLGSGTLTARTLFSDKQLKSFVPVWNLSDEDFLLQKGTLIGDAEEAYICGDTADDALEKQSAKTVGSEPAGCRTGEEPIRKSHGPGSRSAGFGPAEGLRSGNRDIRLECGTFGAESSGARGSGQEYSGTESAETTVTGRDIPKHLQCLLEALPSELTGSERQQARDFISANADVFSASEFDLGRTGMVKHTIDTAENRPFKQQLRRHPMAYLPVIDEHVDKMAANGIVEPAISPWSSNVVLVRKKDGGLRFCVDFRQLNSLTVKDSYALPRTDMCLEAMGGARFFSTLDCRQGYWQIELDEKSSEKTAFVTRRGVWKFKVLPFGLSNAPACFQRLIDLVLTGLQWEICLAFLDDIIVFASTFEQQLQRLSMVFDRLRKANLKLKPSKCRLFQLKVRFLGSIVSGDGIEPDPEKVRTVVEWPVPKNVTETRAFVALASYYRRHIRHFAEIARPLHELTKKGKNFSWGPEQMSAFEELKKCLTTAPVLSPPIGDGKYILDTDASDEALGAVLQQEQDGVVRVIAYASRVLQPAERRYCTTRKELLGIIYGLKQFRHYLLGGPHHFVLRTDHAALTSLLRTREPIGQQARYLDLLSEFNFTIVHRNGSQHGNSDALSRRPCEREELEPYCRQCNPKITSKCMSTLRAITIDRSKSNMSALSPDFIRSEQRKDDVTSLIMNLMELSSDQPSWAEVEGHSPEVQDLWSQWQTLEIVDGILYRQYQKPDGTVKYRQIIVPRSLRAPILTEVHGGITSGHFGNLKTQQRLKLYAYWQGWKTDVEVFVRRCTTCSRFRRGPKRRQGPLQHAPAVTVMQKVHIDLTGPHIRSKNGFVYLLTAICSFTKYLIAVPLRDKSALSVAKALVKNVFLVYGAAELLVHDGGKEFCNEIMQHVSQLFGVQRSVISPYRPSANGMVERVHATINSVFAKTISNNQRNWCELAPYVVFCYNTSYHTSTTFSPFYLMFLREPMIGLDLMLETPTYAIPGNVDDYVEVTRTRMLQAYDIVREKLRCVFSKSKQRYDQRVKFVQFTPGDYVWYYNPRKYKGLGRKWQLCTAPHKIIRRLNMVNYVIQRTPRSQPFITHIDRLKKFEGIPVCWEKSETEAISKPGPGELPSLAGESQLSDYQQRTSPVTTEADSLTAQSSLQEALNRNVPTQAEHSAVTGRPKRKPKPSLVLREQCWYSIGSTMQCVICGLRFQFESGLKKHLLLQHGKRYRRNRSPESVPEDELRVLVNRYRYHQANSKKRKELRAAGLRPPIATSASSYVCQQMVQSPMEPSVADSSMLDRNWPRYWLSESETDDERRRHRPVHHEITTQTSTDTADGEVQAVSTMSSVAIQVRRRPTTGPELPAAGFTFNDLLRAVRDHPELSPAEIVAVIVREKTVAYRQRQLLTGLLTIAVGAERNLARDLQRRLQQSQAAGPDRPELLRQALTELETAAGRFLPQDDLCAVAPTNDLEDL